MKQPAGIDISKDGFHACLKEQPDDGRVKIKRNRSFLNDFEGFKDFLDWSVKGISKGMSLKFVPEATGCYYEDLTYFLHDNGQEACVVPANRIRHHAGSLNVKTGTDKADAALIADSGLERSMPAWQSMSLTYRELRDLCRELSSVKRI
ncbi:Transposase [Bacteroidales bacterium Barb6XT]|nr:Transposase [Bacteroidales bacterium Barb6XT]